MDYNVVSADSHVDLAYLPGDLFVSNSPAVWRDKMPRHVETPEGLEWRANKVRLGPALRRSNSQLTPENEERYARMDAIGFFEDARNGRPHPTTVELRLKDMELDGIDAEVFYGLTFTGTTLTGVQTGIREPTATEEAETIAIIYRIYNDWAADFCKCSPQKLAAIAQIPNHDPEAAVAELRRAAGLGLRGVQVDYNDSHVPIYYDDWDVVWRASAEYAMPVHFHLQGFHPRRPRPEDVDNPKYARAFFNLRLVLDPMDALEPFVTILLTGACERYPDFKFVLGESGVTWLPFMLDRMDHECTGYPGLKMKPSEYFRRQGYATFQNEGLVGDLISYCGEDNVMWGNDYPHPDGVWPDSQEVIQRTIGKVDKKVRRKVICDNAAKLYRFK